MSRSALCPTAKKIRQRSIQIWGREKTVDVVGQHASIQTVLQRCERFARTDATLLIRGETGVGKELVARATYLMSDRVEVPFVSVNCAQYRDGDLLTAELFGHEKGSFTGATSSRDGVLRAAEGGTVFLDEIGELDTGAQAMLLRALSEKEVKPVGSSQPEEVDVRLIVATNRDLKAMVEQGAFLKDLFFRINALRIDVPPLRERGDDWKCLARHFMREHARRNGHSPMELSSAAEDVLRAYHWPGNVREVKDLIRTACLVADGDTVEPEHFRHKLHHSMAAEHDGGDGPAAKAPAQDLVHTMQRDEEGFWEAVYDPYMNRDLNREQVRKIIRIGLRRTEGSYKALTSLFGIPDDEYSKFMDFLRHHDLKPQRAV